MPDTEEQTQNENTLRFDPSPDISSASGYSWALYERRQAFIPKDVYFNFKASRMAPEESTSFKSLALEESGASAPSDSKTLATCNYAMDHSSRIRVVLSEENQKIFSFFSSGAFGNAIQDIELVILEEDDEGCRCEVYGQMYWDLEVEGQFLENRLVFYVWIPIQRFRQIDSSLRTSSLSELKFSVFGMTGVYGDPSSFLPSHIKKLLIHRDDIFFP